MSPRRRELGRRQKAVEVRRRPAELDRGSCTSRAGRDADEAESRPPPDRWTEERGWREGQRDGEGGVRTRKNNVCGKTYG